MSSARFVMCVVLVVVVGTLATGVAHAERIRGELHDPPAAEVQGLAKATCTADCGPYPAVTAQCSGTCQAVDRSCPNRGYVQCSDGVRVYCSEPCLCTATTFCPEGAVLSCTGTGLSCMGGNGLCFVQCDGQAEFCPGHEGELICESDPW
jgi:hypothetical protein